MNWGLFSFVALVSIVVGVVSRRGGITPVEAWTLVLTRLATAAILAFFVPEQLNPAFFVVSGASELARFFEHIIAYTADRAGGKMEARTWLNRSKYRAT